MSISDKDIKREDILKLVRKSSSTNYNSESTDGTKEQLEHRTKFLECRKQFEQPRPAVDKKPFFPYWIKPESNTNLSITYKKRGPEISDVRINYLDSNDANHYEENCLHSFDGNQREKTNRLKEKRSVRGSPSLKINEAKNTIRVFKSMDIVEGNGTQVSRRNQHQNRYSIPRKPIVCRPIVRKVIQLKKYNHILEDVISKSKAK